MPSGDGKQDRTLSGQQKGLNLDAFIPSNLSHIGVFGAWNEYFVILSLLSLMIMVNFMTVKNIQV